jgi:predicted permease
MEVHHVHQALAEGTEMSNLFVLLICFGAGVLLRLGNRVPENAHHPVNAFIIHVALPALTLVQLHRIPLDANLVASVAMPFLLFAGAAFVFLALGWLCNLSKATVGGLMLTAGLGNTSFVGLPMIETFFGTKYLGLGILIDQLGSYMILSTLGIVVACCCAAEKVCVRDVVRRLASFPPFIAVLAALLLRGYAYPTWLDEGLERIGATLAPLALLSVGLQVRLAGFRLNRLALATGLAFKLMVGPILVLAAYAPWCDVGETPVQVALFEAAMPPMIGVAIVAGQYRLNPPLLTLMVGLGIPLSFLTLPLWWLVLTGF